jgi:hypothetical protein
MLAACARLAVTAATKSGAAQTPLQAVPAAARNQTMGMKRIGSQPSGKGPADYFTGTIRIDPLFQAPEPARGASAILRGGAQLAALSLHVMPPCRVTRQ